MNRPFEFLTARFRTVLFGFLLVDLVFILIHGSGFLLHRAGFMGEVPKVLRISEDHSIPESFNYLKWAIIVVALTWVALRDGWWTPFGWALVFLLILADDSLQIHETFGAIIAEGAGFHEGFMVAPDDLGEVTVFGLMGLAVLLLTGLTVTQAGARSRRLSLSYAATILVLGFFGVGIDFIHQAIIYIVADHPDLELLTHVFAFLEDGGEMVVASVAVALTLAPPGSSSEA